MTEPTFFYEAKGQVLVIHLPKELDHHNCRNLRYETDLLLSENYITRMVFDSAGRFSWILPDRNPVKPLQTDAAQRRQCGHLWRGGPDQPDTESGWHLDLINGFSSKEAAIAGTEG